MTMEHCTNNACRVSGTLSKGLPQYWGYYTGIEPGSSTAGSNTPWYYTKPWNDADRSCGLKWYYSHHPSSPRMMPGQEARYGNNDYGRITSIDGSANNNRTYTALPIWAEIGLMTANDDIRGVRLAEQAINYYMTQSLAQDAKSRWAGTEGHGTSYGLGRVQAAAFTMAWILKTSLTVTPPGVLTGNYLKDLMKQLQFSAWIGSPRFVQPWSTGYGIDRNQDMVFGLEIGSMVGTALIGPNLFPSDPYAAHSFDYMRNRRGDYANEQETYGWASIVQAPTVFVFYDPVATRTPISTEPLQMGLTGSDSEECIAAGLYCRVDSNHNIVHSTTGWTSTDTQVAVHAPAGMPIWIEDTYGMASAVTILQNNGTHSAFLLGGNGLGVSGLGSGETPLGGFGSDASLLMLSNGTTDLYSPTNQFVRADRWAGAARTGVTDNSYAYTRVNLTPLVRNPAANYNPASAVQGSTFTAAAGATAVTREVMHLKSGANKPSYVVVYDSGQMTAANQLRAYWHLQATPNISGNVTQRHPEYVSYDATAKTATITVPSAGRLNLKALPVAGSANTTVALASTDYVPPGIEATLSSSSWSGGVATVTTAGYGYGAYPIPTDGTVSITISGVSRPAYNGTFVPRTYSRVAGIVTMTYALASDPGGSGSGGKVAFPPWCSYVTAYNFVGSCNGNFASTNGHDSPYPATYRIHSCASSDGLTCGNTTNAEMLTILQPSADGKTMPPLNQRACAGTGANCTALEILDSAYPKVVMMARQGALATAMAMTSTHSGTAQYIVSGLTPGNYTITSGGVAIGSAGVTAGNTTLSFYSKAGSIVLTQNGGPAPAGSLAVTPSSLHFTCSSNGIASAAQSVGIVGVGLTLDNWTAGTTASWLTLSTNSGAADGTITASINCAEMPAGAYTDSIIVESTTPGLNNSPQTVVVSLTRNSAPAIITSSLPPGVVGTQYSHTLAGIGGLASYSWQVSAGTLCDGLILSVAGVISGTPTRAQTCSFGVRLTDSQPVPTSATASLSITVAATAPAPITMTAGPSAVALTCTQTGNNPPPQSLTIAGTGGTLDNWSASKNQTWLSVVPPTGISAGSLDLAADCAGLLPGSYAASVSIASTTEGVVNNPLTVSALLTVYPPPSIALSDLPAGRLGNSYQMMFEAIGGQEPRTWSIASGALPPALSLSAAGLLSGVPEQGGSASFTVRVTDAGGASALTTLNLVIMLPSTAIGGAAVLGGHTSIR
jgi:hypothetical protein